MFQTILFYCFSSFLILAVLGVIFSKNPVHAAMFLIATFFQSAVLWLLVEAEFLAIVLVLVYVGAVMVLFLFVIMMLDIKLEKVKKGFTKYAPIGFFVAFLMVFELFQVIAIQSNVNSPSGINNFKPIPEGYSNTEALGSVLYTEYVYSFEIAAVILLIAIVGAITLTMRKRPGLHHYLILSAVLFTLSIAGIFINRRNLILLLMCIEIML